MYITLFSTTRGSQSISMFVFINDICICIATPKPSLRLNRLAAGVLFPVLFVENT